MRIGMLSEVYKPYISGITNYISLHKRHLERMGHEVFIFTFGYLNYQDDEVYVIRSPGLPLLKTGYYVNFRHSSRAQKLLRTMDIVHVHHPFISGQLAIRYCKSRGIPIVFTNHTRYDLYTKIYMPAFTRVVGEALLRAYLPGFCQDCDLVIAPAPNAGEMLKRFGVTKDVEIIPNGIDLALFFRSAEPVTRSELGLKEEDILLIYTGRLGPEKNLPLLLNSFALVTQSINNVHLLLVGDGPEHENLSHLVQTLKIDERVLLTGMVPYKELPRYLATADAFVTASVTEMNPLSVTEAMASGLAVLGINSPGINDLIEDGVTGLICPEETQVTFVSWMIKLVTIGEQRKQMGIQAQKAVQKYAIEKSVQTLLYNYKLHVEKAKSRHTNFAA